MEVKFLKKYQLKKTFFEVANWEHSISKLMKDNSKKFLKPTREEEMFQVTYRGKIKTRLDNI